MRKQECPFILLSQRRSPYRPRGYLSETFSFYLPPKKVQYQILKEHFFCNFLLSNGIFCIVMLFFIEGVVTNYREGGGDTKEEGGGT